MLIEELEWNEYIEKVFNKEEVREKWRNAFKDFLGVARIWEKKSGNFCFDKEKNILFIKPFFKPYDLEKCWTFAMFYKEQFIVFYAINEDKMLADKTSTTLKIEDQLFLINKIPDVLKAEKIEVEDLIKSFLDYYSSRYSFPVTFKLVSE